jgi:Peptidase A4 family
MANHSKLAPFNSYYASNIWFGHVINEADNSGNPIDWVDTTITVPTLADGPPLGNPSVSEWDGIGGFYHDDDLFQAGIQEGWYNECNHQASPGWFAWFEIIENNQNKVTNCNDFDNIRVAPGDKIYVQVYYGGGGYPSNVIINNLTTHVDGTPVSWPAGALSIDDSNAEFTGECPGECPYGLWSFSGLKFSSSVYGYQESSNNLTGSNDRVTDVGCVYNSPGPFSSPPSQYLVADPNGVSNLGFSPTWDSSDAGKGIFCGY